uniref:non-specific serine/threonine protein kinase n=1 Tax=Oryza punctata TaxID=4537 RepID=A0A0E0L8R4_ORYPU
MAPVPISAFSSSVVIFFIFFLLDGTIPILGSDDHSALMSFKSCVSNDPNGALANWGSPNVCNWTGVYCGMSRRRVVKLMLRDQKLSGEVSPALGNLSHLNILNLSGNLFAGRVPPELGNLFRLTLLDISSNTFVGGIPAELGNLSSLNTLDLSRNLFTGEVPPELGDLSDLQQLSLGNNLLEGKIPVELTRMSNLSYLNLGENNLTGHIPPAIFCNFSSLQYIDLSSNSLDGEIPIDCPLPNLMFLVLWANNLVGDIPRSLSNSTKLKWLLLESNYLSGELPADMFGGMRSLELLYLSFNYLRSPGNNTNLEPFFASLTNCTSLKELGVAGNELAGVIPPLVGRLGPGLTQLHLEYNSILGAIPANLSNLTNLTALNLSHNLINGSIPPAIAGMRRLERLYLSDNMLSGEIPPSLGEIPRLGLVDLSRNRLAGDVPAALSNLTQLRWLVLHHNHLAGVIPPGLAQCVNLQNLDLSHNMLRGKIPDDLSELSGLLYLNLSSNLLEGMIPATIGKMAMLQVLNLSSNRLSGDIPPQLGGCVALEYVNVSGNALEGGLPDAVAALPFLQVLDVSCNVLSGALPPSLGTAASLRRVNFSYNGFSGEVPGDGAFANFPADAFLGDDGLCGVRPGMARCSRRGGGDAKRRVLHDRRVLLPIVITVVGFTLAILGVVACRAAVRAEVVRRDARRSMLLAGGPGDEPGERDHPRISHRELAEATGGFEQASLIGAGRFGRVYEGTLRDGTRVAVKVLDPKSGGEVSRSFKRECEVLRRTRHRNLVRVVTTCSQPDFHALVLPLMRNGSLESRLYPRDGRPGRGLGLAQLVAVAADVAEGLAYLHHYAPVRVVHCDLKPSNVLLDDDMTAVVADFGIAKLVKNTDGDVTTNSGSIAAASSDPCNSITGLLQGSVGYIAPEYGLGGHPSPQGDVYSFGVMILELITGKRPTDVIFNEGLTLHDWVRRHYPHDVAAVVARSWLTDAAGVAAEMDGAAVGYNVVAELIDVGLACTQHSPPARPTMVEVCHEIALLKEDLAKHGHGGGVVAVTTIAAAAAAPPSVTMTASERSCSTSDSSLSY